jgi:hypothetical protein
VKDDQEYSKTFNNTGLTKRSVSNDCKSIDTISMANRVEPKHRSQTTSEVNKHLHSDGNTEELDNTKLPPNIDTNRHRTQKSRRPVTTKVKENNTDPIEPLKRGSTDRLISDLPSITNQTEQELEFQYSDTEDIQAIPSSVTKKETVDLMESIAGDTVDPDIGQLPSISNTDEPRLDLKKSDTEEMSQDTFKLIFNSQKNKNHHKRHIKSLENSQPFDEDAKEPSVSK